jgi:cell envelope opacity-associated protein A
MDKVRIINKTTGAVKFVMPHVANDVRIMNMYGFVIEDLKVKEETRPVIEEKDLIDVEGAEIEIKEIPLKEMEENINEVLDKPKRTRQPNKK